MKRLIDSRSPLGNHANRFLASYLLAGGTGEPMRRIGIVRAFVLWADSSRTHNVGPEHLSRFLVERDLDRSRAKRTPMKRREQRCIERILTLVFPQTKQKG